jgi:hypothetical protein
MSLRRHLVVAAFVPFLAHCQTASTTGSTGSTGSSSHATSSGSGGGGVGGGGVGGGGVGGAGGQGTGGAGGQASGGAGGTSGTGGGVVGCPGLPPIAEPTEQLFVAPGGVDTAAGTQAAPLATLGEAAKRFPTGGTVIVRAGTYPAQKLAATGTIGHPLVIRPAQGETVTFDGSALTKTWDSVIHLTAASNVVLEGLEIRNGNAPNATGIASDGPVSNLTIRGSTIHDMNGSLARFSGTGIHFEGNEMYRGALVNENNPTQFQNGGWPTCMGTMPDTKTPASPWASDVVIRGNHIHDCWGEGIGIWYGANVQIHDNVVERAFNVGIYLDDASNVDIQRNFVLMQAPMALGGKAGSALLMGVEPYSSLGLAYAADHDVTIVDNVLVGGSGIGWWTSSNTSANNTYGPLSVAHNTIVATAGAGLGFSKVAAGATAPAGCKVVNNVISETGGAYLSNPQAFTLEGNAWLNTKPSVAGPTDVVQTLTIGAVDAAADVEPLAAQVGAGVVSGVATDFLCAPRSATAPIRGAFEH